MDCESSLGQCVCSIVRDIAKKQDKFKDDCLGSCTAILSELKKGIKHNFNTIPLLFTCKNCDYFIASGVFKQPGTMIFNCIETPVFRVSKVFNGCCAELELLQAQTATGTIPPITNQNGVCRFFPVNQIERFIRTGICIIQDLNCFCGVQCLPAVNAQRETPQFPPPPCLNPFIDIDASNIDCSGIVTGTVTCNGEPVENAEVTLSSSPEIVTFTTTTGTETNTFFTDANGNFVAFTSVEPDTEETDVVITAETTVNNITVNDVDTIIAQCENGDNECGGCGINVGSNEQTVTVTVNSPDGEETFTGNIEVNVLSCGVACNPANNLISINFNDPGNATINFTGRRVDVDCTVPSSFELTAIGRVIGNNPFPNNVQMTATIQLTGAEDDIGEWTIEASDGNANSFTTSFTGNLNPNVIQECPPPLTVKKKKK